MPAPAAEASPRWRHARRCFSLPPTTSITSTPRPSHRQFSGRGSGCFFSCSCAICSACSWAAISPQCSVSLPANASICIPPAPVFWRCWCGPSFLKNCATSPGPCNCAVGWSCWGRPISSSARSWPSAKTSCHVKSPMSLNNCWTACPRSVRSNRRNHCRQPGPPANRAVHAPRAASHRFRFHCANPSGADHHRRDRRHQSDQARHSRGHPG